MQFEKVCSCCLKSTMDDNSDTMNCHSAETMSVFLAKYLPVSQLLYIFYLLKKTYRLELP